MAKKRKSQKKKNERFGNIPDDEICNKSKAHKGQKNHNNVPRSDPIPKRLHHASNSVILRFYRSKKQPVPQSLYH